MANKLRPAQFRFKPTVTSHHGFTIDYDVTLPYPGEIVMLAVPPESVPPSTLSSLSFYTQSNRRTVCKKNEGYIHPYVVIRTEDRGAYVVIEGYELRAFSSKSISDSDAHVQNMPAEVRKLLIPIPENPAAFPPEWSSGALEFFDYTSSKPNWLYAKPKKTTIVPSMAFRLFEPNAYIGRKCLARVQKYAMEQGASNSNGSSANVIDGKDPGAPGGGSSGYDRTTPAPGRDAPSAFPSSGGGAVEDSSSRGQTKTQTKTQERGSCRFWVDTDPYFVDADACEYEEKNYETVDDVFENEEEPPIEEELLRDIRKDGTLMNNPFYASIFEYYRAQHAQKILTWLDDVCIA